MLPSIHWRHLPILLDRRPRRRPQIAVTPDQPRKLLRVLNATGQCHQPTDPVLLAATDARCLRYRNHILRQPNDPVVGGGLSQRGTPPPPC